MALLRNLKKISPFSAFSVSGENGDDLAQSVYVLGARDGHSADGDPTLKFKAGQTVLDVVIAHRIPIATACGGMGTCGTCRIETLEVPEDFSARNEIEEEFARDRGFKENERLACQVDACDGLRFHVPPLGD